MRRTAIGFVATAFSMVTPDVVVRTSIAIVVAIVRI